MLGAHLDGPPVGSKDGFRERFPCLRHPSAPAHSLPAGGPSGPATPGRSARRTHPPPGRPGSAARQQWWVLHSREKPSTEGVAALVGIAGVTFALAGAAAPPGGTTAVEFTPDGKM